jgi:NAD(P)-dependent dehydrogenase (short-subunit alcohol dehydrogenase family)
MLGAPRRPREQRRRELRAQPSEWDPAVFEESLRINLSSAFRALGRVQAAPRGERARGGASVLNVASMSSFAAVPAVPGYGAAKAGIVQMTQNLAVAWAADRIRVNAVAPGLIATGMTAGMRGVDAAERPFLDRTPMRRWGEPADVVPLFLLPRERGRALRHRTDVVRRRRVHGGMSDEPVWRSRPTAFAIAPAAPGRTYAVADGIHVSEATRTRSSSSRPPGASS